MELDEKINHELWNIKDAKKAIDKIKLLPQKPNTLSSPNSRVRVSPTEKEIEKIQLEIDKYNLNIESLTKEKDDYQIAQFNLSVSREKSTKTHLSVAKNAARAALEGGNFLESISKNTLKLTTKAERDQKEAERQRTKAAAEEAAAALLETQNHEVARKKAEREEARRQEKAQQERGRVDNNNVVNSFVNRGKNNNNNNNNNNNDDDDDWDQE